MFSLSNKQNFANFLKNQVLNTYYICQMAEYATGCIFQGIVVTSQGNHFSSENPSSLNLSGCVGSGFQLLID